MTLILPHAIRYLKCNKPAFLSHVLKTIIGNYSSWLKVLCAATQNWDLCFWAWFDYDAVLCCRLSFSNKFYATVLHYKCTSFFHVEFYQSTKAKPIKDFNMFPTCGSKQIKHLSQVLQTWAARSLKNKSFWNLNKKAINQLKCKWSMQ